MSKKVSWSIVITIVLIAMAVTFSVTMSYAQQRFNGAVSSVSDKERMYNKLAEVDRYVRANAYYPINDDTLNDMIGYGYMQGISDRYARYYSARANAERMGLASGQLMGVGVAVVRDASSGYGRIIRVYANSPASETGLQVGGFITAIGDTSVRTLADSAAITSALLGEEGSTVTLGYLTPDRQEQTVELRRANYTVTTVAAQLLEDGCGYLRIDDFAANTGTEFRSAVDSLLQQGATGLLFDLRDNTGDDLNAALIAADRCVTGGVIARNQASDGSMTDLRVSDEQEINVPMVCLVNSSTAGGAELFANAVRKMGGGAVVGTTTAGKGVVLSEPQSLSDGSALVVTVGILIDNEGQTWDSIGLSPDVESTLTADEQAAYYDFTVDNDPQITRARSTVSTMLGGITAGSSGTQSGEGQSTVPEGEGDTGEAVVPEGEEPAADGE